VSSSRRPVHWQRHHLGLDAVRCRSSTGQGGTGSRAGVEGHPADARPGNRLKSVTLNTGPREAMAMSGRME